MFAVRIEDDRGQKYRLIGFAALVRDPRWPDPRYRAAVERAMLAARAMRSRRRWRSLRSTREDVHVALFVALMVLGVWVTVSIANPTTFVALAFLIPVSLVVLTVVKEHRVGRGEAAHEIGGVLLADSICPACGYGLGEQRPDVRGLIVCPECSAAWRGERIGRRRIFDEGRPGGAAALSRTALVPFLVRGRMLKDDTGAERCPIAGRLRYEVRAETRPELRNRLLRARADLLRVDMVTRSLLAAPLILITPALLLFVAVPGLPMVIVAVYTVCAPVFLAQGICIIRGDNPPRPTRLREVMTRHALCPSCAQDLAGRPLDEHRCATCPVCGGVWRVPDGNEGTEP